MQLYGLFVNHFSGVDEYKKQYVQMKHELEVEELKRSVAEYDHQAFRQEVASILGTEGGLLKKNYPLRQLANVTSLQSNPQMDLSAAGIVFDRAKRAFVKKEYGKAIRQFKLIVDKYSYSSHIVETQFLLAECYFQSRNLEMAVETIQALVANFPESEMTGFALLRLGKIFEIQDRKEEALGVYQTVLQSFKSDSLSLQAKQALESINL